MTINTGDTVSKRGMVRYRKKSNATTTLSKRILVDDPEASRGAC